MINDDHSEVSGDMAQWLNQGAPINRKVTRRKREIVSLADLYCANPLKACRLALRRTAHLNRDDRMQAINQMLACYGVEAIRGEWQNGYWCDIVACYCNTGDTYALTIVQKRGELSFRAPTYQVTSLGDFVERNERRLKIK